MTENIDSLFVKHVKDLFAAIIYQAAKDLVVGNDGCSEKDIKTAKSFLEKLAKEGNVLCKEIMRQYNTDPNALKARFIKAETN